jgi:hypothetical protein
MNTRNIPEGQWIGEQRCPNCDFELCAAFDPEGERDPRQGDACACINCHAVLEFGEGLKLRIMSEREIAAMPEKVRHALAAYIAALTVAKLAMPKETKQ